MYRTTTFVLSVPILWEQVADEAVGHKAGDLVFIVETLPHPDFTRRNDDLHMDMDIPLVDALVRSYSGIHYACVGV